MKAKRSLIHLGALLLLSPALHAQQKQLSLQEAVDLSIRNSKQLKLSDAKVLEATAGLREARERRLPDASIQGAYLRVNQPNIDMKTGSKEGNGEGGASATPEVNQVIYGMATVSVPLFSGFRINYGIESAKYLEQAAKLDAEKDREEVIQNTISAYSNLYKASAAVNLVKENLRQSEQRVSDFSNLEKNGLLARNDLLKAQLQQSNVELSLLDAENNLRIANINMNLMLGLPRETELLTDTAGFRAGDESRSAADWEMLAFNNRKDAAALDLREKASYTAIKAAKGEYYPSVALTGGYVAADVQNFLTVTNALNAGVGLKYSPSSLWKNGAKVAQAKARHAQTIASQQILDDAIRIQVNQSYQSLLLSNKKIEVYAKAVEQANENYKIVKNKYDNNLANTTDLLDADVAQLQARLNYAFAKADALVAYNRLLQTAGILDKNIPASNQ